MFEFIENNFVAIIITVFLILFVKTNNNFEKKVNRHFLIATLCILILIFTESLEFQYAQASSPDIMRVFLSAIGYTLRPTIPYFLAIITKNYTKKEQLFFTIPIIFNALVSFSALFCKISFWYTPDNQFARGPLGYTPFVIAAFYVIFLLVKTMQDWRKGGFREAFIVSAIVLLAFFSTVLESVFGFRFIQNPCMATSITFYYLFLNSAQNNRDPLTGAFTRRKFYLDAQKYNNSLTAVISLDINNLKILNDEHGHVEGDRALVSITRAIQKYMGSNSSLYRCGGDEFMILCFKLDEQGIQTLIDEIRKELKTTPYCCAIGYAPYSIMDGFDDACRLADDRMYQDKRATKKQI